MLSYNNAMYLSLRIVYVNVTGTRVPYKIIAQKLIFSIPV